jgi:hypothetical protein
MHSHAQSCICLGKSVDEEARKKIEQTGNLAIFSFETMTESLFKRGFDVRALFKAFI